MTESGYTYATLQEFNDEEMETWLYFLRWQGNEKNLTELSKTLESIEWVLMEGGSTFDIDIEHLVSERTAKEITKLELNVNWHRKFDGVLQSIDFEISDKDDEDDKIEKVNEILGNGGIEEFIDEEDIDEEDLRSSDSSSSYSSGYDSE
jgi:hypothetical protein